MPPKSSAVGLKDILFWTLLLPVIGALQQQPYHNAYPSKVRPDGLAKDAASVAHRLKSGAADSLQTSLSGQRGYRDTHVDGHKLRTRSLTNERALATLSPPESNPAVRAPPAIRLSAHESAGLTTRQPARSLQDWQVEDIILLATVDGMIHARDRRTGAAKWQIYYDQPMVETTYHRHNKSVDENGLLREDPLWIVEPSQDGSVYMYAPGSGLGMQKLEYTVKELTELGPYASDGSTAVTYTAERRNFLYHINAADGNVLKTFSPGGSHVNDDRSCRRVNPLESLDDEECEPIGTIAIGRAEYTLAIHDRNTGEPITTIKYFEWTPNTRDQDLRSKYTTTMDKRYVYTKYDGTIFGMDLGSWNEYNPGRVNKPIYRHKLTSPVAQIFDIVRPQDDPSGDAALVILPQPVGPSPYESVETDPLESIFVNCTSDGSWYALSESKYPTVTEGATSAKYSINDPFGPPPISLPMSRRERELFMGVHHISQGT